jgi:hypothetical protein
MTGWPAFNNWLAMADPMMPNPMMPNPMMPTRTIGDLVILDW